MFALSTAWCSGQAISGDQLLSQISQTGLDHIEIDYRVTPEMLQQMRGPISRGEFTVVSVHNYCPLPAGVTKEDASHFAPPSTLDQDLHRLAVRHSIKTLQGAADLGARVVVFHLGEVDIDRRTDELHHWYQQGQIHSEAAQAWREAKLAERRKKAAPYLDAVLTALDPIHEQACKLGVYIGAENRYRFNEIPFADEWDLLFAEFRGGHLRYWHDTGHAELNHRLGFLQHEQDLLIHNRERLIGFHLHDIRQLHDHQPPGLGDLNFAMLKPYVSDETVNVLEIHHPATARQIGEAVNYLHGLGF
jgi:sugar phosphate isomerase/epimerase